MITGTTAWVSQGWGEAIDIDHAIIRHETGTSFSAPVCGAEHDDGQMTWGCTRSPGHRARHIASTVGRGCMAAWPGSHPPILADLTATCAATEWAPPSSHEASPADQDSDPGVPGDHAQAAQVLERFALEMPAADLDDLQVWDARHRAIFEDEWADDAPDQASTPEDLSTSPGCPRDPEARP